MGRPGIGPLYTWIDVADVVTRAQFAGLWPRGVAYDVTHAGMYVEVAGPTEAKAAIDALKEWFGARFVQDPQPAIALEPAGDRQRHLLVTVEETDEAGLPLRCIPSFRHVVLLPDDPEPGLLPGPEPLPPGSPVLAALYSFKGGVGRSTHALALARAATERAGTAGPAVLLVDADLEAPGLTWWMRDVAGEWRVSFLDLLALAQYDETDHHRDMRFLVTQGLRQQMVSLETRDGRVRLFFLPAFRSEEQALRMRVRPEHVVRIPGQAWLLTDLLAAVGQDLGVQMVVVDLRAGFSEVASPFIFDPRVRRILVTTPAQPSVQGTSAVLRQVRKVMPGRMGPDTADQTAWDPVVILSMVTSHGEKAVADVETRLLEAYPAGGERNSPASQPEPLGEWVVREQPEGAAALSTREGEQEADPFLPPALRIERTAFVEDLLHLGDAVTAWDALKGTSVLSVMWELAEEWLAEPEPERPKAHAPSPDRQELRAALQQKAESWVFAEHSDASDFLRTGAWEQLARRYSSQLPLAVVLGAKGAGKTFLFLQLLRLQTWQKFLQAVQVDPALPGKTPVAVVPMLYPSEVAQADMASRRLASCRDRAQTLLGRPLRLGRGEVVARIQDWLGQPAHLVEWSNRWIELVGMMLGIDLAGGSPLIRLQETLRSLNARVVVTIDGLEQVFDQINHDHHQQTALRALCQELPAALAEIPDRRLGLVAFVRKDLARAAIQQNYGQFEKQHQPYQLRWNPEEALRLAVWLCKAAGIAEPLGMRLEGRLEEAPRRVLEQAMIPVWGYRLGRMTSTEAITANWVIAALSDLTGQLQPRDVVRFFQYAARRALEVTEYDSLYQDRLLPPAAVRYAIGPCSTEKVNEVLEEAGWLKGIIDKLRSKEDRRIPFRPEEFRLTAEEVRLLKEMGMVLEDENQLYMPEIYRHGLGFRLGRGARPRVLTLMRRAAFGTRP